MMKQDRARNYDWFKSDIGLEDFEEGSSEVNAVKSVLRLLAKESTSATERIEEYSSQLGIDVSNEVARGIINLLSIGLEINGYVKYSENLEELKLTEKGQRFVEVLDDLDSKI